MEGNGLDKGGKEEQRKVGDRRKKEGHDGGVIQEEAERNN